MQGNEYDYELSILVSTFMFNALNIREWVNLT
jgi:hypothetical protein